jgi:hypothetical protein
MKLKIIRLIKFHKTFNINLIIKKCNKKMKSKDYTTKVISQKRKARNSLQQPTI